MIRAPLRKPLSMMQTVVADLLGLNKSYAEIATVLDISPDMVREHAKRAAEKIPGDLPTQMKCVAWSRGATEDVLMGHTLRYEIAQVARQKQPAPHSGDVSSTPVPA